MQFQQSWQVVWSNELSQWGWKGGDRFEKLGRQNSWIMVTGQGSTLDEAQVSDWVVVPFTETGNTEGGAGFAPILAPHLHKWHHH